MRSGRGAVAVALFTLATLATLATLVACDASQRLPAPADPELPAQGAPTPEPAASAPAAPAPAPPAAPACDRATQARAAPAALFDALRDEVKALGGSAPDARAARVTAFLEDVRARGGAPLEDGDRVVVLARGAALSGPWAVTTSEVAFATSSATPMTNLGGTDLWWAELVVPRTRSFTYKLLSGVTYLEDPLARHVVWDGVTRAFGKRGELNGVGHAGAWPADRGRLVALDPQRATALGNTREVLVYVPPRYDDGSCTKLPSVVFHDGNESITRGDFAGAADALYRARPELSALLVFVGLPSQDVRSMEYGFGDGYRAKDYVAFLADELAPAVSARFRLCTARAARGISGASLGGLVSTYAAFERAGTWGWVGAQSASFFWGDEALIARAKSDAPVPTRFYLDSGCPNDNCEVTTRMASTLVDAGYEVKRVTAAGAKHEWSAWNARLGEMLTHFRDGQSACD